MKMKHNVLDGLLGSVFFLLYTLLLRAQTIKLLPIEQNIMGMDTFSETFHLFKSHALILFVSASILSVIVTSLTEKGHKVAINKWLKYPLLSYAALIVLSYAFSAFKDLGWRGSLDRYEGLPTLLAYCGTALAFYCMTTYSRVEKWLGWMLPLNLGFMSIFGLSQMLGHNIIRNRVLLSIIAWPVKVAGATVVEDSVVSQAYGTLGNSNFMGSYLTLVLPVAVMLYLRAEDRRERVIRLLTIAFGYLLLLGSNSLAGVLAYSVLLPVYVLMIFPAVDRRRHYHLVFAAIVASGITAALPVRIDKEIFFLFLLSHGVMVVGGKLLPGFKSVPKKFLLMGGAGVLTLGCAVVIALLAMVPRTPWPIERFEYVSPSKADMTVYGQRIQIKPSAGGVEIDVPDLHKTILMSSHGEKAQLTIAEGRQLKFVLHKDKTTEGLWGLTLEDPKMILAVGTKAGSEFVQLVGNGGSAITVERPETVQLLNGLERLGSGRVYIWSRTIPMLKSRIIIGSGPDSFIASFPQNDIMGKSAVGSTYLVVDKPHSWFLELAVNTGLVSVLSILALLIGYYRTWFLRREDTHNSAGHYIGAVSGAIAMYSLSALFNDSMPSVSPLFWAFIGIGFALMDHEVRRTQTVDATRRR